MISGTQLHRCALILAVALGGVLGFWASSINEHSELPGVKSVVQIQSWVQQSTKGDANAQQLLEDLGTIAAAQNSKILVELPTLEGRTAYVAGDGAQKWIQSGYRGLPWSPTVDIQSLSALPHRDYRQMFEFTGGHEALHEVTAYLDAHGVKYKVPSSQQWAFLLAGTALGKLAALVVGMAFALALIGTVLNSHTDAVRRLHGIGMFGRVRAELFAAGRVAVPSAVAVVVAADMALWGYSNAASARQLLFFQLVFIAVAALACIAALFIGLIVLKIAPVVELLKGKLPVKSVLFSMFALRLGACIAIASFSIAALNYTTEWNRQENEVAIWQSSVPTFGLTLSGARDLEDLQAATGELAGLLREISTRNRLLYAQYRDSGMSPESNIDRDVMVYNSAAAQLSLSGAAQRSFEAWRSDTEVLVLVPDSLPAAADVDQYVATIVKDSPAHKVTYRGSDSRALTWEVGLDEWMNRAETVDPIIVVIPNSELGISDRNLVAAVTQHDVLLRSYTDFQRLQSDETVGSFVRAAVPMTQTWSQHHQAMGRLRWVYLGGLFAAVLLCVFVSLSVWASFIKVFHQKIRAAYLHAFWPLSTFLTALLAEIIAGCGVYYFMAQRSATAQAWQKGGVAEGAADPAMISLFHVPTAAWWLTIALFILTSLVVNALLLGPRTLQQLVLTRR